MIRYSFFYTIVLVVCMIAPIVQAESFTIFTGQTIDLGTEQKVLLEDGDIGTIEAGGELKSSLNNGSTVWGENINVQILNDGIVISTGAFNSTLGAGASGAVITNNGRLTTTGFGSYGIYGNGDSLNATIIHSGTIITTGEEGHGISSGGDNAQITSSGTIDVSGLFALGIYSRGDNADITHSGTIITGNDNGYGILASGDNGIIKNSGTITTQGVAGYGIWTDSSSVRIEHSGAISTTANDTFGILSNGSSIIIDANGTIVTQGSDSHGVYLYGSDTSLDHRGTITVTGLGALGIYATGANNTIDVSGSVSATGAATQAIVGNDNPQNLNVLSGANIIGDIDLRGGNDVFTMSGGIFIGDIDLGDDDDVFTMTGGYIIGNIDLGGGNNTFTMTGGRIFKKFLGYLSHMSSSENTKAISNVVDQAFSSDSGMMDELDGITTVSELDAALGSLVPTVDGGAVVGSVSAGTAATQTVSTRLASLRSGTPAAGQGLASGDALAGDRNFWMQGFGTFADQKERQGFDGFDALTAGYAFGADKPFGNDLTGGLSFSYAATTVNSDSSANKTMIDSYQVTGYGSYKYGATFLDSMVSVAYNDYDGVRNIAVGSIEEQAKADYWGIQGSFKAELGREFKFDNEVKVTPSVAAQYNHLFIKGYTETDADTANLNVDRQNYDSLYLTAQSKFSRSYELTAGTLTPEFHVGYMYEALDEKVSTTSTFTGGGGSFKTTGFDPANHSLLAGVGLTFLNHDNLSLTATYDVEGKQDYISHSFLIKGEWQF